MAEDPPRRLRPSMKTDEIILARLEIIEEKIDRAELDRHHIEEKIDRIEKDNLSSHRETSKVLGELRVLVGEHGVSMKHYDSRIQAVEERGRELESGLGDLSDITGQHKIDAVQDKVKVEEEKRKAEEEKRKELEADLKAQALEKVKAEEEKRKSEETDRKAQVVERRKWALGILAALIASILGGTASHLMTRIFH